MNLCPHTRQQAPKQSLKAPELSPHYAVWVGRADLGWEEEEQVEGGGAAALSNDALTRDW